ncbi:MAG: hypothetical protein DWI25_02805 [Planctomycetota bacterium]|nr:MAG: hypothetical protein DWI25_02805 [Planctomycetota bacterium]
MFFRPINASFFGKILKVFPIVTTNKPPTLFSLCKRLPATAILLALLAGCTAEVASGQTENSKSVYRQKPESVLAAAESNSAVPAGAAAVDTPPDSGLQAPNDETEKPESAAEQQGRAERIVAATLAGLARAQSLSARVRQRVRVGDRVLVGSGRYVQSGLGEDQRFRYESAIKSDTEEFELLEVCDGLFFWTYRKTGSNPPQVERVDLRRVRDCLAKLPGVDSSATSAYLGGVQRVLALLREWFRFSTVHSTMIDDLAIWNIQGQWNVEGLAGILPAQAEAIRSPGGIAIAELPDGMPYSMRLSISKRELFPLRIEWLAIPGKRPVAATKLETVAVLELYDVHIGEPVDASAFVYKPATEGLIDCTDTIVNQLLPLRP